MSGVKEGAREKEREVIPRSLSDSTQAYSKPCIRFPITHDDNTVLNQDRQLRILLRGREEEADAVATANLTINAANMFS